MNWMSGKCWATISSSSAAKSSLVGRAGVGSLLTLLYAPFDDFPVRLTDASAFRCAASAAPSSAPHVRRGIRAAAFARWLEEPKEKRQRPPRGCQMWSGDVYGKHDEHMAVAGEAPPPRLQQWVVVHSGQRNPLPRLAHQRVVEHQLDLLHVEQPDHQSEQSKAEGVLAPSRPGEETVVGAVMLLRERAGGAERIADAALAQRVEEAGDKHLEVEEGRRGEDGAELGEDRDERSG